MPPPGPLLERESQIALLGDSVAATRSGDGPLVVVRGVAGIGKTRLLEVAESQGAGGRDCRVAGARRGDGA